MSRPLPRATQLPKSLADGVLHAVARRPLPGGRLLVAGLGNPGPDYEATRHNLGAMVLNLLLGRTGGRLKRHKSGCLVAESRLGGASVVLARATSFMNESGGQLVRLARWYRIAGEEVIVVHDELDLPFGDVRIKAGGGTAGHNGVRSVASHLGTAEFVRVRGGIGRPPGRTDPVDFVLSEFSRSERVELPLVLASAADAVERVVEVGAERAMNEVNTRRR